MDRTLPLAPLNGEETIDHYLNAAPSASEQQRGLDEHKSNILVYLGDDEVAPVDEGDHLSL